MRQIILILGVFFSILVMAQDAAIVAPPPGPPMAPPAQAVIPVFEPSAEAAPWEAPETLKNILDKAYSVPVVGPIVVEVLKWLGVICSVLTALATAFFAIARTLSASFKLLKLVEVATKIDAIYTKYSPYIKFFSMYNVQKDELKKKA